MRLRLLPYRELRDRGVPWSNSHITRLEKAGKFPRRVILSNGTSAWIEEEIDAYVAAGIAARDEPAAADTPDS